LDRAFLSILALIYVPFWYDPECQHYYFGYRHYDPRLGRWLSRDPLGEAGGFNLYAYCGNDPVNRHDPLGLVLCPPSFDGKRMEVSASRFPAVRQMAIFAVLPATSETAARIAAGRTGLETCATPPPAPRRRRDRAGASISDAPHGRHG
jgi:RHS repeat-associated protein